MLKKPKVNTKAKPLLITRLPKDSLSLLDQIVLPDSKINLLTLALKYSQSVFEHTSSLPLNQIPVHKLAGNDFFYPHAIGIFLIKHHVNIYAC